MNNHKVIQIGSAFLKEYLTKIEEMKSSKKITDKEAFTARIFGENAINVWSGLFSDEQSPFSTAELPEITEESFDGMMKAFAYFTFAELDEVFHIYNSPFQDKSVKDMLVPLLSSISKDRAVEIISAAIEGEDVRKYLGECEKIIAENCREAKTPEGETIGKYLLGAQIMFNDSDNSIIKTSNLRRKDMEEFAMKIYKRNMINLASFAGKV